MKKIKRMQKKLVKQGAIIGVVVVVAGGALFATGSMKNAAVERKNAATSARDQDNAQIASMRGQIDQSGAAEKRFIEIELAHPSGDYATNSERMKETLRDAKDRYRFANSFKLTLPLETKSAKPEFSALNYDVIERLPVKIELGAISDAHVFSFLDELQKKTPGLLRITNLEMTRRADMDISSYTEMLGGQNPENVGASIEFTWVGIEPKPTSEQPAAAAPAPSPTGGM
ncbi:MAG: hypothetical protein DI582_02365 [Azospirillum brasilense]|nr:MAG: hypothetical protein DI582_02365 [Azospirillum brasilense]